MFPVNKTYPHNFNNSVVLAIIAEDTMFNIQYMTHKFNQDPNPQPITKTIQINNQEKLMNENYLSY